MNKNWLKNKDFSQISVKFLRKITSIIGGIFLIIILFFCFEIYIPVNPNSNETIVYTVQKGWGDEEIAKDLQKLGIIRSSYFFELYGILSLKHINLKAGEYNLSSKMSIYQIASKMARGDIIRDSVVILEGWDIADIGKYLEEKDICYQDYFTSLAKQDYSARFEFLKDKPKKLSLEGYLFPDTYEIAKGETCEGILDYTLENFDKKLSPVLREEIKNQKKSIFTIVTMASLIEKEVRTLEDKKIVSGILWKRLAIGMPLQLDSTVNYITGRSDPRVAIKDTQIDSPYNTYKYRGLPNGPISNPGLDSIIAAIYPTKTDYLYYLTDGKTIFSKTFEEHQTAREKYFGS